MKITGLLTNAQECEIAICHCINGEAYPASLQLWKVYRVLPDEKGARHNLIRVIDKSGEDYLFSASYFVPVKLPQSVKSAILATA